MLLTSQPFVQLGQGFLSAEQHIHTAEVSSLQGAVRRKRSELAVGIDGEGVQLYDLSNAKQIASYAIPPQDAFSCPPTSIRQKKGRGSGRRLTYASLAGTKSRICRWEENIGRNVKLTEKLSTHTWQSTSQDKPIIWLGSLGQGSSNDTVLLAIYQDGSSRCFSEDLQQQLWSNELEIGSQQVQSVFLLGLEHARAALLKNREDLLVKLDALRVSNLFVVITKPSQSQDREPTYVRILVPHGSQSSSAGGSQGWMEELVRLEIPATDDLQDHQASFHFFKPSATLIQQSLTNLTLYDLTGTVLKLVNVVSVGEPITSSLIISTATVAVTTSNSLWVLDTNYGSVKAVCPLHSEDEINGPTETNNEGRRNDERLVTYTSPSSTAFVLSGGKLVAFQLNGNDDKENPRRKIKKNTLADAIGRGIGLESGAHDHHQGTSIPPAFGTLISLEDKNDGWRNAKKQLNAAAKEGNATLFDETVSSHLGLQPGSVDVHPSPRLRTKIYAILGMLFRLTPATKPGPGGQRGLKLRMIPPVTVGWLVEHGFFTQSHVELSLKHAGKISTVESLPPCAVIDAVYSLDSSLQTLLFILSSQQNPPANDIVQTIHRALQVFQQAHALANKTRLLTGPTDGNDTEMRDYNDGEANEKSPSPEPDADKVHDAHALMRICLDRLALHTPSEIQKAFRSTLPQPSLLAFIDYLRLDLASGGWFSHHNEAKHELDEAIDQPADHLYTVCRLLNAAIDSLGVGAWLGTSMQSNIANTVSHMRAEAEVACEAVTDARFLQSLLHEMLLFAKHKPPPPIVEVTGKRKYGETTTAADGTKMVKPITIGTIDRELNYLPIGLKPRGMLFDGKEKTKSDGEVVKRSMRDLGRLKSMQVGAYSFERIMI